MTSNFPDKWLVARLIVIGVNVAAIMLIPSERSNIDWGACFFIAIVFSVAVFGWMTLIRNRVNAHWPERYGWRLPFLPMNRYPFQFWFLTSQALILAGAGALLRDFIFQKQHKAVSATFLFMGLFAMAALRISASKFARRTSRS
jgi:hypothetical protein